MLKLISTAIIASVLAAGLSAPALASDGGDAPVPSFDKSRSCEGAVRSASMSLAAAERALDALQGRTATRAEYNKARDRVAKAEQNLARARGRC